LLEKRIFLHVLNYFLVKKSYFLKATFGAPVRVRCILETKCNVFCPDTPIRELDGKKVRSKKRFFRWFSEKIDFYKQLITPNIRPVWYIFVERRVGFHAF
jgi:hypothetical protein